MVSDPEFLKAFPSLIMSRCYVLAVVKLNELLHTTMKICSALKLISVKVLILNLLWCHLSFNLSLGSH